MSLAGIDSEIGLTKDIVIGKISKPDKSAIADLKID